MPDIPSLSGLYIDQTYQRLVQVSGSSFADGLGNPISIGISGGTDTYIPLWSGSNALTSSFLQQTNNIIQTVYEGAANSGILLNLSQSEYRFGAHNTGNFTNIIITDELKAIDVDSIGEIRIGDTSANQTITTLIINDISQSIKTSQGGFDKGLSLDFANFQYSLGDHNNINNGTKIAINDVSGSISITGSVSITGSATLNGVTLEPASVDGIDLSSAAYDITSWGVYRITTGDNTLNHNLNLPDPTLFPGREISIINSDQTNQFQFGTNAPYKLSGTSGWSLMEPNIMMLLKSIGGKWIGPKIPES
jgi:hypothetical protein